jgi:hypothetical protein
MSSKSAKAKRVQPEEKLSRSLEHLDRTISELPEEYSLILHPGKHLIFTYLKGIIYGLGVLTAVAIVIPLLVALLRSVEWVPLVGDFVERVVIRIEQQR